MKQTTILLIKFFACIVAFGLGFDLFFDASFVTILTFSFFVTISSYVLGDRIILPQLGKRAATIADFLLTYLSVWIFGSILLDNYLQIAWGSIISASIVTVTEVFVHLYVYERLKVGKAFERERPRINSSLTFGTEFAEEEEIKELTKKDEH